MHVMMTIMKVSSYGSHNTQYRPRNRSNCERYLAPACNIFYILVDGQSGMKFQNTYVLCERFLASAKIYFQIQVFFQDPIVLPKNNDHLNPKKTGIKVLEIYAVSFIFNSIFSLIPPFFKSPHYSFFNKLPPTI